MSGTRSAIPILRQRWDRIVNYDTATNGDAWSTPGLQSLYRERAAQSAQHHSFQSDRLGEITEPVGGIANPKEVGLWNNQVFYRLAYRPQGMSDKDLAFKGTSEWLGLPELFRQAAYEARNMSPTDIEAFNRKDAAGVLVDLLRVRQALGFIYNPNESAIIRYVVKGPTVALAGPGKRATHEFEEQGLATIGAYQPTPQVFVPGIIDPLGKKDRDMIDRVLEVDDIISPVGFLKLD